MKDLRIVIFLILAVGLLGCAEGEPDPGLEESTTLPDVITTPAAETTEPSDTRATTTTTPPQSTADTSTTTVTSTTFSTIPETTDIPDDLVSILDELEPELDRALSDPPTVEEVESYLADWHHWWRWVSVHPEADLQHGIDTNSPLEQAHRDQMEDGLLVLHSELSFENVTVTPGSDVVYVTGIVTAQGPSYRFDPQQETWSEVVADEEPMLLTAELILTADGEWVMAVFELGQA